LAGDFAYRHPPRRNIGFAGFRLIVRSRTLLYNDEVVPLGSRAFDLLHSLTRSAGAVISKEELVQEVWPTTTVEESNLRFQMASLRKALGTYRDLIKTIPGRGYLFTGDCFDPAVPHLVSSTERASDSSRVPAALASVTAAQLRALIDLLEEQIDTLNELTPPKELCDVL